MARKKKLPQAAVRFTIGYCRKSTDSEDKQVRSLEDQRSLIQECFDGLPAEEKVYKLLFMEESRSAYIPNNRPEFEKILRMADRGEIHRIIVLDPTRISRNHEDTGMFVQRLADGRLPEVLTVTGKQYGREDSGQIFMLTLENTMSWKDSADKGVRVSQGMQRKAEEGGCTGWAPIGYENVSSKKGQKYMRPDPQDAPKVRQLFVLASTGAYSLAGLTKEAKKLGLRTRPTRVHPEGKLPQKTSIAHMLHNPTYKGMKQYNGKVYQGTHDPIVDTEIWEKARLELTGRATNTERPKDISLRELFLMAGCVRCGHCKKRVLSPYKAKGQYIIYECKNPKSKCRNCINQDELLKQLYAEIARFKCDDADYEYMRRTLKKTHEKETKNQSDRRKALEREYHDVEQKITDVFMNIGEAKRMGIFDSIEMQIAQLQMRKNELQEAMDRLHGEGEEWIDHVIRSFELVKLTVRAIQIGSPETRQAVLKAMSSNYYVTDKKLVIDWVSPYKEMLESDGRTVWLLGLDSNQ